MAFQVLESHKEFDCIAVIVTYIEADKDKQHVLDVRSLDAGRSFNTCFHAKGNSARATMKVVELTATFEILLELSTQLCVPSKGVARVEIQHCRVIGDDFPVLPDEQTYCDHLTPVQWLCHGRQLRTTSNC